MREKFKSLAVKFAVVSQTVGYGMFWVAFSAFFAGADLANGVHQLAEGKLVYAWINLSIAVIMGALTYWWVRWTFEAMVRKENDLLMTLIRHEVKITREDEDSYVMEYMK